MKEEEGGEEMGHASAILWYMDMDQPTHLNQRVVRGGEYAFT
jgi:hypothetical protein